MWPPGCCRGRNRRTAAGSGRSARRPAQPRIRGHTGILRPARSSLATRADCVTRSAAARRLVERTRIRCHRLAVIRPTFYTSHLFVSGVGPVQTVVPRTGLRHRNRASASRSRRALQARASAGSWKEVGRSVFSRCRRPEGTLGAGPLGRQAPRARSRSQALGPALAKSGPRGARRA